MRSGFYLPLYQWVILAVLLLTQASWIFLDAAKRKENKWLWGLYGLTNVPSSLIIYLLVTRVITARNVCGACKKKYRQTYKFCPYCGKEAEKVPGIQDKKIES